jgi:hypothetical protein
MALTESKLRQIIREEAAKVMSEMERTPRGLAGPRGPRDRDDTYDVAVGRGDGGRRMTMGGRDEDIRDPSPYMLDVGTRVWDTRSGPDRKGTVEYPPHDDMLGVMWDDARRVDFLDVRYVSAV